ncbi:hypothetical protein MRB53_015451 [Persea americana]|uniref:Uncharacterized protein n=1 Tax=Persea americana TaxID=3435 RepID=A0ACC2KDQ5_PERAE|nr:hypothetical protein MRB53_015451 [Persea americana]
MAAIQVVIKIMARKNLGGRVLAVVQDRRLTNFRQSLVGAIESSGDTGVIFFSVFPDYMIDIGDTMESLHLRVQSQGFSFRPGTKGLCVQYNMYYKMMNSSEPRGKLSQKEDNDVTTMIKASSANSIQRAEKIKWGDIHFPKEWEIMEEKVKDETSNISAIQYKLDGRIILKFNHSPTIEEPRTSSAEETRRRKSLMERSNCKMVRSMTYEEYVQEFETTERPERLNELVKILANWKIEPEVQNLKVTGESSNHLFLDDLHKKTREDERSFRDWNFSDPENNERRGKQIRINKHNGNNLFVETSCNKLEPISTAGHYLDLDKCPNISEIINAWGDSMNIVRSSNPEWSFTQYRRYIEKTLKGIVGDFWKRHRQTCAECVQANAVGEPREWTQHMLKIIRREFGGIEAEQDARMKEIAKSKLTNLAICDLRYLEEYEMEFKSNDEEDESSDTDSNVENLMMITANPLPNIIQINNRWMRRIIYDPPLDPCMEYDYPSWEEIPAPQATQIEAGVLLESAKPFTSKHSIYIETRVSVRGYHRYTLNAYVDTGAGFNMMLKHALPNHMWKKAPIPLEAVMANTDTSRLEYVAHNIHIFISGKEFLIDKVWQTDIKGQPDLLLGNNFIQTYEPFVQTKNTVQFTLPNGLPVTVDKVRNAYAHAFEPAFLETFKKPPSECPDEKPGGPSILFKTPMRAIESSGDTGVIFFSVFPDYMIDIGDTMESLHLRVQSQGFSFRPGTKGLCVQYNMYYKMMNSSEPRGKLSQKEDNDVTTMIKASSANSIQRAEKIKWGDIHFPKEWEIMEEKVKDETSNISAIQYKLDGRIILKFNHSPTIEEPRTSSAEETRRRKSLMERSNCKMVRSMTYEEYVQEFETTERPERLNELVKILANWKIEPEVQNLKVTGESSNHLFLDDLHKKTREDERSFRDWNFSDPENNERRGKQIRINKHNGNNLFVETSCNKLEPISTAGHYLDLDKCPNISEIINAWGDSMNIVRSSNPEWSFTQYRRYIEKTLKGIVGDFWKRHRQTCAECVQANAVGEPREWTQHMLKIIRREFGGIEAEQDARMKEIAKSKLTNLAICDLRYLEEYEMEFKSNDEEDESSDTDSNVENLMMITANPLPNIIQINNRWMRRIIYDPPLDPCMEYDYPSWEEIPAPQATQIEAGVLLESAKPFTSKHSIYIETRVSVRGYHRYTLNAYVDTGAGFNMMLKHALPNHMWKKAPIPLEAVMANTDTSRLEYVAHNIHIFISGKEFLIDKVWQTDIKGQPDLLLGNNFIQTYEPFVQTKNTVQFTLPNGLPVTVDKVRNAYAHAFEPAFLETFKKPPSECPDEKPGGPSILFKTPMRAIESSGDTGVIFFSVFPDYMIDIGDTMESLHLRVQSQGFSFRPGTKGLCVQYNMYYKMMNSSEPRGKLSQKEDNDVTTMIKASSANSIQRAEKIKWGDIHFPKEWEIMEEKVKDETSNISAIQYKLDGRIILKFNHSPTIEEPRTSSAEETRRRKSLMERSNCKMVRSMTYEEYVQEFETTERPERLNELVKILANWKIEPEVQNLKVTGESSNHLFLDDLHKKTREDERSFRDWNFSDPENNERRGKQIRINKHNGNNLFVETSCNKLEPISTAGHYLDLDKCPNISEIINAWGDSMNIVRSSNPEWSFTQYRRYIEKTLKGIVGDFWKRHRQTCAECVQANAVGEPREWTQHMLKIIRREFGGIEAEQDARMKEIAKSKLTNLAICDLRYLEEYEMEFKSNDEEDESSDTDSNVENLMMITANPLPNIIQINNRWMRRIIYDPPLDPCMEYDYPSWEEIPAPQATQIEAGVLLESAKPFTSKHSIYIETRVSVRGYHRYTLNAYVDTGAGFNMMLKHALPNHMWKKAPIPLEAVMANTDTSRLEYVAHNIHIFISGKEFLIDKVWQTDIKGQPDLLLGNNFIQTYEPFVQTKNTVQFTLPNGLPVTVDKVRNAYAHAFEPAFLETFKKPPSECPDEKPGGPSILFKTPMRAIESSGDTGVIFFSVFPDYMIDIGDTMESLHLRVQSQGFSFRPGTKGLCVQYNMYYKMMNSSEPRGKLSQKEDNDVTTMIKASSANSIQRAEKIKWGDIHFPKEWEIMEEKVKDETSNISAIQYKLDGRIILKFNHSPTIEEPRTSSAEETRRRKSLMERSNCKMVRSMTYEEYVQEFETTERPERLNELVKILANWKIEPEVQNLKVTGESSNHLFLDDLHKKTREDERSFRDWNFSDPENNERRGKQIRINKHNGNNLFVETSCNKLEPISTAGHYLDLDKCPNISEIINAWGDSMNIVRSSNPEWSFTQYRRYIEKTLKGIVGDFWKRHRQTCAECVQANAVGEPREWTQHMLKIIRREFGGIEAEQDARMKEIAKSKLTNLAICDLRYLEEYEMEFKSNDEEDESSDTDSNVENLMMITANPLPNIIQINNRWMRRIIYDPPLDPCMEYDYPSWEEIPAPQATQIEAGVLLESAKPFTSKHSIYIETRVSVRGYHRYTLNAYVDTGAGFNMMLKHALPNHMWKKAPIPLEAVMANTDTSRLEYVAHNIHIFISGKEFLIDKVWQTDIKGQPDLLLGNNFIQTYEPFVQTKNTVQFTLPNGLPVTVDKVRNAYAHAFEPAFLETFKKPPSECPDEKPGGPSILFKTPMRAIESSGDTGVIFFSVFPDYMIDIGDTMESLHLRVQSQGFSFRPGTKGLCVQYNMYYKMMNSSEPRGKLSQKEDNDVTTMIKASSANSIQRAEKIKWGDIHFPKEWEIMEEKVKDETSNISAIQYKLDGRIILKFNHSPTIEEPRTSSAEETRRRKSLMERSNCKMVRSMTYEEYVQEFETTERPERLNELVKILANWKIEPEVQNLKVTGESSNHLFLDDLHKKTREDERSFRDWNFSDPENNERRGKQIRINKHNGNNLFVETSCNKLEPISTAGHYLDLDKCPNISEIINAWGDSMNIVRSSNPEWSFTQYRRYIEKTLKGIVGDFWKRHRQTCAECVQANAVGEPREWTQHMLKIIRREFGGIEAEQDARMKEIAKSKLTNLAICDLRYLEEYEMEFKSNDEEDESSDTDSNVENLMMITANPLPNIIQINNRWMRRIIYDPPLDPCMEYDYPSWEEIPAPQATQIEAGVLLESAKPFTSKHSIYIETRVSVRGYHRYTLNAYVDTGAGFNMMLKHALPNHMWKKAPIPLEAVMANTDTSRLEYVAHNIHIFISGKEFLIDKVWQTDIKGQPDLLLGNNFIQTYEPFVQTKNTVQFTLPNGLPVTVDKVRNAYAHAFEPAFLETFKKPPSECPDEKPGGPSILFKTPMRAIESSGDTGVIFFSVFPDYMIDIGDTMESLHLRVQSQGFSFRPGTKGLCVQYNMYYKMMNSSEPRGKLSQKEDNDVTTMIKASSANSIQRAEKIKWGDIHFPKEWEIMEEKVKDETSNISAIQYKLDGRIILKFNHSPTIEEPRTSSAEETRRRKSLMERSNCKMVRSMTYEEYVQEFETTERPERLNELVKILANWKIEPEVQNLKVTGESSNHLFLDDLHKKTREDERSFRDWNFSDPENNERRGKQIRINKHNGNNLFVETSCNKLEPISTAGHYLDLDKCPNISEIINAWGDSMNIVRSSNPEWSFTQYRRYIEKTLKGIVGDFWKRHRQTCAECVQANAVGEPREWTQHMLKIIRREFGGIEAEQDARMKEIAKSKLTNLAICDLRYLEEYEMEFKSNDEEDESSDTDSNVENLMMITANPLPNIIQINNRWMRRIIYDPPLDPCMEYDYPSWEEIPAPQATQIEAGVLLESAKPFTSKHSIYIETRVSVRGYHRYTLNAYVDTGAGFNMMLKHALPNHMWKKAPIPLEAVMANTDTSRLEYVAHNIHIFISGKEFLIDKVWQTDIKGQPDLLLGNNFIQTYEPFVQTKNTVQFTLPNGLPVTVDKVRNAYAHAFEPAFLETFKKPPSECPDEKPGGPSILFKTPMRSLNSQKLEGEGIENTVVTSLCF